MCVCVKKLRAWALGGWRHGTALQEHWVWLELLREGAPEGEVSLAGTIPRAGVRAELGYPALLANYRPWL